MGWRVLLSSVVASAPRTTHHAPRTTIVDFRHHDRMDYTRQIVYRAAKIRKGSTSMA